MLHFWNKARYFASSKYSSYCSFPDGVPGVGASRKQNSYDHFVGRGIF